MKHFISTCLIVFSVFLFAQDSEMVEIETQDGNIFLGTIVEESAEGYQLKTQDGIIINVPTESVKSLNKIETASVEGTIFNNYKTNPDFWLNHINPNTGEFEANSGYGNKCKVEIISKTDLLRARGYKT